MDARNQQQGTGSPSLAVPRDGGEQRGPPARPAQPPPGTASPQMARGTPQPHPSGGKGGAPPPSYREYDERKPLKRDLKRDEEYQAIDHDYPNDDDDYEDRPKEVSGMRRLIFIITRLCAWACSGVIILVGAAQWFEYLTITNLHISTYIVASYLIFFGLLFGLCELTDWGLRPYFGLLFSYTGRGLAYIFVGSLCFGMANERYWPLGLAAGCSLLGVGGVLIFVGWVFTGLPPLDPFCHSSVRRVVVHHELENDKRYRRDY